MPRTFHPLQATSQGSSGLWQLWGQSLWGGYTLLAQLSRVGRGWWKPRGHPGVNATPPAMFRRGLPGALALLPTAWAACRQEGRCVNGCAMWVNDVWMDALPPCQPSSAKHLSSDPSSRGWAGLPPAWRVGRENEKILLRITGYSELERGRPASQGPTCPTRPAPDEFAPRRQTSNMLCDGLALRMSLKELRNNVVVWVVCLVWGFGGVFCLVLGFVLFCFALLFVLRERNDSPSLPLPFLKIDHELCKGGTNYRWAFFFVL